MGLRGGSAGRREATALDIEDADRADLDDLTRLFEETLPGLWSRTSVESEWSFPSGILRVARDPVRGPVGFIASRATGDEAEVMAVGVAPDWRGGGLGRRLVDDTLRELAHAGVRRVHLELRASNAAARRLYEGAGFVVRGRRPRYYRGGEDALLMSTDISTSPAAGSTGAVPVRESAEIAWNRDEGGTNRRLGLRVPGWPGSDPGQFVMLSAGPRTAVPRTDPLLPRPMAVYRESAADDGGTIVEILYKVTGRGTGLLAEAVEGQRVGIVGPLGRGFRSPAPGGHAVLVGGGTGIASLYGLASVAARDAKVSVLLGGRSEIDLMGREDFAALDVSVELATEDGSVGTRGLVTALLERALAADPGATVYACGPTPMMQRCAEIAAAVDAPCQVSLENGMACGFGVCLGCAAPRSAGGYALVCREGPVFDATQVVWDRMP